MSLKSMKKSHIVALLIGLLAIVAIVFAMLTSPKGEEQDLADREEIEEQEDREEAKNAKYRVEIKNEGKGKLLQVRPREDSESSVEARKLKKIESFMNKSRLRDELKAMDDLLAAQLDNIMSSANLSAEEQEELEKMRNMVSSEALEKNYKELMQERFNEEQLDRLNEIHGTEEMKTFNDAKVYNQSPEGQQELMSHFKQFDTNNLPAERVNALRDMDKASGTTENTLKMMSKVSQMTMGDKKDSPEAAKAQEQMEKMMRPMIEKSSMAVLDKNFQNSSFESMKKVSSMMEDPAYQLETQIRQDVVGGTVDKMAEPLEKATKRQQEKFQQDN